MNKHDQPAMGNEELVKAWQEALPAQLNKSDRAEVKPDAKNPDLLRIHIDTAGHSGYTFDFSITYLDDREIKVELVDVEKDNQSIDEHTEIVQNLIEDYVRHIHECAQVLQRVTHHHT